MRGKQGKCMVLLLGCLVLGVLLTGCESGAKEKVESWQDFFFYSALNRLDRQNSVYVGMESLAKDALSSEDRTIQSEQFQYLCRGVNIFIRDELKNPWYNQVQEEQEDLSSALEMLMNASAKYELEHLWLGDLSDEQLEQLETVCHDLAECCNRNQEGSLAYQVSIQDDESTAYQEALVKTKDCVAALEALVQWEG